MDVAVVLLVIQAIGLVILAAVGVIKTNRTGIIMLVLGGVIIVATAAMIQVLNQHNQNRSNEAIRVLQVRIDELHDILITISLNTQRGVVDSGSVPQPRGRLRIDEPEDDEPVPPRPVVRGSGAEANQPTWLIVHPAETGVYWVQPPIVVGDNGTWSVQAYMGRDGTLDTGKRFELMAVANPTGALKEGQTLDMWPEAEVKSHAVAVVRK